MKLTEDFLAAEYLTSDQLTWSGATTEQILFMRRVYDINLARSSSRGTFVGDVPETELGIIEGNFKARILAALSCRNLLLAIRSEINEHSLNISIGLTSAYRSASHQYSLWQDYFPDYYNRTRTERENFIGGEHSEAAAQYLAQFIRSKIATPGFSNHNNGLAVDFLNVVSGVNINNKTLEPHLTNWHQSWIWKWLIKNAATYNYFQNTRINEPWHWEYRLTQPQISRSEELIDKNEEESILDDLKDIPPALYQKILDLINSSTNQSILTINPNLSKVQFSVDNSHWPDRFEIENEDYRNKIVSWIKSNRDAIADHPELVMKTFRSRQGYEYDGHPSRDPMPNWGFTEPNKMAAFDHIRLELFAEGGASSINTYDEQLLTIGWGFSCSNEMGIGILRSNIENNITFREALLNVGITIRNNTIWYIDLPSKSILKGIDALEKIRFDKKTLSQLIYSMEHSAETNVASQARMLKTNAANFPEVVFSWPPLSIRLAVHLKHWLPTILNWNEISTSGGDVIFIIKKFLRRSYDYYQRHNKAYFHFSINENRSLYVKGKNLNTPIKMANGVLSQALNNSLSVIRINLLSGVDSYKQNSEFANNIFIEHNGMVYIM